MRGQAIDTNNIHWLLWARRDSLGCTKVHQGEFAKELKLTQPALCRAMKRMEHEGLITVLRSDKGNIKTYVVKPPEHL